MLPICSNEAIVTMTKFKTSTMESEMSKIQRQYGTGYKHRWLSARKTCRIMILGRDCQVIYCQDANMLTGFLVSKHTYS